VGDRHGDDGGKPSKGAGDALGICGWDIDSVTSIRVHGWADVPAFNSMRGPRFALCRLVMDNNLDARWSQRSSVEVELAVDLGPGRKFGVIARLAEEIEGHDCLWE
jgi:hypothetical protein